MSKIKTIYLLLLAGLVLLAGCGKDDGGPIQNPPEEKEPEEVEELFPTPIDIPVKNYSLANNGQHDWLYYWYYIDCDGNRFHISYGMSLSNIYEKLDCNKAIIINSSNQMSTSIGPSMIGIADPNNPEPPSFNSGYPIDIDFATHTLLLPSGVAISGISNISGKLQHISPSRYRLNIEITRIQTPVREFWVMPLITTDHKLGEGSKVEVNVTEIEGNSNSDAIIGTWKCIGICEPGTKGFMPVNYDLPPA